MGVKNKHGMYNYRVYDVKTNELLAEGIGKRVAEIMKWEDSYPNSLAQLDKKFPDRKRRFERLEREWMDTIYQITDCRTNEKFTGNYDQCADQINRWLGKKLKPSTMKNYIYRDSSRFEVRKLNNV